MNLRSKIDAFLGRKRFAMVGVSRHEKDFSRSLFRAFCEQGYDVVPVNPGAKEIEGRPCYAAVKDVPDVQSALLMTPPKLTQSAVGDCADAGLDMIWIFRAAEAGTTQFCESHGIEMIDGKCPFMFIEGNKFPHSWHAGLLKILGRYPAA